MHKPFLDSEDTRRAHTLADTMPISLVVFARYTNTRAPYSVRRRFAYLAVVKNHPVLFWIRIGIKILPALYVEGSLTFSGNFSPIRI